MVKVYFEHMPVELLLKCADKFLSIIMGKMPVWLFLMSQCLGVGRTKANHE